MENREFIGKIIQLYHEARIPAFPDPRIRRGESRSISALTEDLFASYLAAQLKQDTFLVNQQFFCQENREKIKPDVSIVRDGVIIGLIDVKMDAGFKRTILGDFCQWQDARVGVLRGKILRTCDGVTKVGAEYLLAKDAEYHIVLVSRLNIGSKVLKLAEDR